MASPKQYYFQGRGVTVAYYPDGLNSSDDGPGENKLNLTYASADLPTIQYFYGFGDARHQVRRADHADLGTLVSVIVSRTDDGACTTFSLVVPAVELPSGGNDPVSIRSVGITRVDHDSRTSPNEAQRDAYRIVTLRGRAAQDNILDPKD